MAAIAMFELHPYTRDVAFDDVYDFLESPHVGSDQTKVVIIWEVNMMSGFIFRVRFEAIILLHIFQDLNHRIKFLRLNVSP